MRVCWMRKRKAGVFYRVNAMICSVIRRWRTADELLADRWRTNAEPLVNRWRTNAEPLVNR